MTNEESIQALMNYPLGHPLCKLELKSTPKIFPRTARVRLINHLYDIYITTKDMSVLFAAEMLAQDGEEKDQLWKDIVKLYEDQKAKGNILPSL